MGALHAGHESLIRRAREQCDLVMVTIFVNHRQFNDASDLASYPRSLEADRALCQTAGADVVIVPTLEEMWPQYPATTATTVSVAGVSEAFEGAQRPGHFDGVASVVAKLFALSGACTAFFGDKDYQQLAVIRRMVLDLAMPVTVVGCPIVRDPDGLALSSRNVRLSASGRERALGLSRALAALSNTSMRSADEVRATMAEVLGRHEIEVAYAEVVDPTSLVTLNNEYRGEARALIAGVVEGVRLLDNGSVTLGTAKGDARAVGH